jgi:hypothetical protein
VIHLILYKNVKIHWKWEKIKNETIVRYVSNMFDGILAAT